MKLIKHNILDERERHLIHQAGYEAFSFMIFTVLILYFTGIFVNNGLFSINYLLVAILASLWIFFYRSSRLGVRYYDSVSLTVWGCLATNLLITLMIMVKNFQVNHLIYGDNPLNSLYLVSWLMTFVLYLPWVFLGNYLLTLFGNYQKARFERKLDECENE